MDTPATRRPDQALRTPGEPVAGIRIAVHVRG
jgi:hypothetical protein